MPGETLPGDGLHTEKMPGHWLLARLGKRVLRPGGLELTRILLDALAVGPDDDVVEFAPGLGVTARMTLARRPRSYCAIERDPAAVDQVRRALKGYAIRCQEGSAEATGLAEGTASVVYGEAMLSMQTPHAKARIMGEAHRLLRPGGRYGIHELCLQPDDLPEEVKAGIRKSMSEAIHVGVRPLTVAEWQARIASEGFDVVATTCAPFHLLEPRRLFQDEGIFGALRFISRVLRNPEARKRVLLMRRTFRKYRAHLAAVMIVARKPD
jgi:SAM-dependent methyltransferase